MERYKKLVVASVLASLLVFPVVPYFQAQAQTCDPSALRPVSFGQRGPAVRNAQACLIEAGYDIPAGATGYYGSQTRTAVREFYADWYGQWPGNTLGPRGVAELKSRLLVAEVPSPSPSPAAQLPTDVLLQALARLQAGDLAGALALLQQAMGGAGMPTPTPTPTPSPSPSPVVAEEGLLIADKNPTPASGQQFREGETVTWVGVRFRAQDSDITVHSFKLTWPTGNNVAPSRVVTKFEVVDDQGNVLKTIDPSTFIQDQSTLDYYVYVTGLNYLVRKNTYRPIFVRATAVSTFPSGFTGSKTLRVSDIRGRDTAGIDRYPNVDISNNVNPHSTLATSAYFVVSRSPNSPVERNVMATDPANNRADNVEVLRFSLMAKNDNLKVQQIVVDFDITNPSTAYLYRGNTLVDSAVPDSTGVATFTNLIASNIVINRDASEEFSIHADYTGLGLTPNTSSVKVVSVTRQNSLGDTGTDNVSGVVSDPLYLFNVGPEIRLVSVSPSYTPPSQTASSSYQVVMRFNVTPRGGTVYMGTSTNIESNFVQLRLENSTGTLSVPDSVVVKLYLGGTDVTNSHPVHATTRMWVLNEGTTYTFEITGAQNGVPSGSTPGLHRWKVTQLLWTNDSTDTPAPDRNSSWVSNTFVSSYQNIQ